MNVSTLRGNLLLGTALAVGVGLSFGLGGAAVAQSSAGYGSSYRSGAYSSSTAPTTIYTPREGGSTYTAPVYGAPSYTSSSTSTPTYHGATTTETVVERQPVGGLMPGETAPPDAVRDPALWAQWQKHGQYEYDRGYEAGRRDAMSYMQTRTTDVRTPTSSLDIAPATSASAQTYTRMSDRYDGPRADATRYDTRYNAAAAGGAEPWWSTSWDRMVGSDWSRTRDEIRRRWPQLTGYDVDRIQGQRSMLLTVLQDRYNLSNERAHEQVVAWQQQLGG